MKKVISKIVIIWAVSALISIGICLYKSNLDLSNYILMLQYVSFGVSVVGVAIISGANKGGDILDADRVSNSVNDKDTYLSAEYDNYLSGIGLGWLLFVAGGLLMGATFLQQHYWN